MLSAASFAFRMGSIAALISDFRFWMMLDSCPSIWLWQAVTLSICSVLTLFTLCDSLDCTSRSLRIAINYTPSQNISHLHIHYIYMCASLYNTKALSVNNKSFIAIELLARFENHALHFWIMAMMRCFENLPVIGELHESSVT